MCDASLHEKEEMLIEIERFAGSRGGDFPDALELARRIADSGRSILLLEGMVKPAASEESLEQVFGQAITVLVADNDPEVVCRKLTEIRDELSRRRFELVRLLPKRS